jgi:hypothetical protein
LGGEGLGLGNPVGQGVGGLVGGGAQIGQALLGAHGGAVEVGHGLGEALVAVAQGFQPALEAHAEGQGDQQQDRQQTVESDGRQTHFSF